MNRRFLPVLPFLVLFSSAAMAENAVKTPSAQGASVYIISPQSGETVPARFKVKFGLNGMGVAPAGTDKANTGHHHLLVNGQKMPDMDSPMGAEVMHFGGGQTETELTLKPGRHTLQLILGDKNHVPHAPPVVSEEVVIYVK